MSYFDFIIRDFKNNQYTIEIIYPVKYISRLIDKKYIPFPVKNLDCIRVVGKKSGYYKTYKVRQNKSNRDKMERIFKELEDLI